MLAIGHRGAAGHQPENTLRGVLYAVQLGVDWIEIDVQEVDGQLIVFHDDTLERTTNGSGPLQAQAFDQLRALDAGAGEQIPTLTEVLDLIGTRTGINIELKGVGIVDAVTAVVADYQTRFPSWRDRILLSSFDKAQTAALATEDRNYYLGVLFEEDIETALARAIALKAYSINPSLQQVTQQFVDAAHAAGLKVLVYTVNEPQDIAAMQALGVDGVFSDYPDRVIEAR